MERRKMVEVLNVAAQTFNYYRWTRFDNQIILIDNNQHCRKPKIDGNPKVVSFHFMRFFFIIRLTSWTRAKCQTVSMHRDIGTKRSNAACEPMERITFFYPWVSDIVECWLQSAPNFDSMILSKPCRLICQHIDKEQQFATLNGFAWTGNPILSFWLLMRHIYWWNLRQFSEKWSQKNGFRR